MMTRSLFIAWYPIVIGIWYAIWAFLTPWAADNTIMFIHAIVCASVGVAWCATILALRLCPPRKRFTSEEQVMFDVAFYPLLVLGIISFINLFY